MAAKQHERPAAISPSDGSHHASLRLLTTDDAAKLLNVGRTHLYGLMERGELAFVKVGRCRRIRATHIDEFIQKNTFGGQHGR